MKFYLGLVISILLHLLLFALLSRTHFVQQERESVFEVDIVAPSEVKAELPEEIPEEVVLPPVIVQEPLPKVKPKAIYVEGEDEGDISIDSDPDIPYAADDTEEDASPAGESEKVPEEEAEEKGLPAGENVFAFAIESSLYVKESVEQRKPSATEKKKALVFGDHDRIDSLFIGWMLDKIRSIERSIEGDVTYDKHPDLYVGVVLNRDGSVADLMILRPSGHIRIDEAVLKNIIKAEPWPFPGKGYDEEQYGFSWHYIYGNRGRYTVEHY